MRVRAAVIMAGLVASCSVAPPLVTTDPPRATLSPVATSAPRATPPILATPGASVALPDGLERFAWSRTHVETDVAGSATAIRVTIGWLGSPASLTETVDSRDGDLRPFIEGDVVALVKSRPNSALIDVRRPDGTRLGDAEIPTVAGIPGVVLLDPGRSLLYTPIAVPAGGIEILRINFADDRSSTLLRLDGRFAPDGIPTERAGYTLQPDGTLVALACSKVDGCRLWQVSVEDEVAGPPMLLAKETPIVCYVVGATQDWLVVTDDDVCYADTGDAPLPLRAISLRDGSSRLIANDHILAGRVLQVGGRAVVAASLRSNDWSTSDIVAIDVESGERRTLVEGLPNSPDGLSGWLGVSHLPLVGPWVLIAPWGVDRSSGGGNPPNARLLNLETEELIELPAGTFGWD